MAEENDDPLGLKALAANQTATLEEGPGDGDPLGLRAKVKKKDSTIGGDNTSGASVIGSNPFQPSRSNTPAPRFPFNEDPAETINTSLSLKAAMESYQSRQARGETKPNQLTEEQPDEELGAGESMLNSFSNFATRLKGTIPRLNVVASDVWENVLGKELTKDWYELEGRDIDQERITAYAELGQLASEIKPTLGLIDSYEKGSVTGMLAGVVNTITSLGSSAIPALATGGAGIFTEMTGDAIVEYNNEKAKRLGMNIGDLYASGQSDLKIPAAIGAVSGGLEMIGLKGASNLITKKLAGTAFKKASLFFFEANKEGTTEWLQTGLQEANKAYGEGESDEQASSRAVDKMFSKEGLESYLQGVVGSGTAGAISKVPLRSLVADPKSQTLMADAVRNIGLVEMDYKKSTNLEVKEVLATQINQSISEIATLIENDAAKANDLTFKQRALVERLDVEVSRIDAIIDSPEISAETKQALTSKKIGLQVEIEKTNEQAQLLKQEFEVKQVENQADIDLRVTEFQAKFPNRTIDPLDNLPEGVVRTFDRVEANVPTDIVAIDEASGWLYGKYKELTAMKLSDTRTLTIDQINSTQEQLEQDITLLEKYKENYYGDEQSPASEGTENASSSTVVQPETALDNGAVEGTQSAEIAEEPLATKPLAEVPVKGLNATPEAAVETEPVVKDVPALEVDPAPVAAETETIVEAPAEQAPAAVIEPPSILRSVDFNNPDLGDIRVEELDNGTFNAVYEDGNIQNYSKEEVKEITGFDPELNLDNEFEASLDAITDPNEAAVLYDQKVRELGDLGSKEGAIAQYRPTATKEEFSRFNDGNNMTQEIRLQYTPTGKKGRDDIQIPLDTQAQEINDQYFNGEEVVTPNDLADFMVSYPNGASSFTSQSGNAELRAINAKYKALTGKNLRKDTAARMAEKYSLSLQEAEEVANESLSDEQRVQDFMDRELQFVDGFAEEMDAYERIEVEFNNYLADPTNDFNLYYDIFQGRVLEEEEINNFKKIINGEQQTEAPASQEAEQGTNSAADNGQVNGSQDGQQSPDEEAGSGKTSVKKEPGKEKTKDSKTVATEKKIQKAEEKVLVLSKEYIKLSEKLISNLMGNQTSMLGENQTQSMFDDRAAQQKLVDDKEAELNAAQEELVDAKNELIDVEAIENQVTLSLPDRIRSLKSKKGQMYGGLQGIATATWDGALETLATAIEAGQSISNAMRRAIDYIKENSSFTDEAAIEAELRQDLALQGISTTVPVQPTKDPSETIPEYALRLAQFRKAHLPNLNPVDGNLNGNGNVAQVNAFAGNWTLPEESRKDKLVRKNVDFLNRLENAENAIKAAGGIISAEESAYVQSHLLSAKAGKKIDDVLDDVVQSPNKSRKSLFQRVKESSVDITELGLFTYAQHAPERNAYVAEMRQNAYDGEFARLQMERAKKVVAKQATAYIDRRISLLTRAKLPGFELLPDGGSGMTNAEAADILSAFQAEGKTTVLEKFAEEYRNKVTRPDLQMQLENGLISDTEFDAITKRYKNYVPLQVEEYVKKGWAANIKNLMRTRKTVNRTKGSADRSFNERVNPVLYGLVQLEKSTIESSKNEWLTTLKDLVINNPNDDIWQIVKPKYAAEYNKDGSVKKLTEITPKEIIDQSVKAFDNGKAYYIQLKDDLLRRAITKEGVKKGIPILNSINSFYRGVYTTYNPNFILDNSLKDPQEALFMMSGQAKGIKKKFLKSLPVALKGIYQHQRGNRTSPGAVIFEEYLNAGGKITFNDSKSDIEKIDNVKKALEKMGRKKNSPLAVATAVKDWFDDTSSMLELTTRVAAFKAAKESGMSQSEAAQLSRNATVDFAKKGELTAWTNSVYLFANAGTQGGFNMLKRVITSKHGRKVMGAYVMAGFVSAMLNSMMSDEEDDKNDYWKIPDYQRSTSLVMKIPGVDGFFKVPVGRTLSVPFYAGSLLYGTLTGRIKPIEATKEVIMGMMNTYNPVGGGTQLLQVLSPTITDPIVQASTNKNNFGSPITKEQKFGTTKPNSESYFKNTNPLAITTTKWLNEATGGSVAESGIIDISPNRLEWVMQQAGGGSANFVKNNILRFSTGIGEKEWTEVAKDAPLLGRFYTTSKATNSLGPIFETLEKSATSKMDAEDKKSFLNALKSARKAREIKSEDISRYKKTYEKNQKRISVADRHPDWTSDQVDAFLRKNK